MPVASLMFFRYMENKLFFVTLELQKVLCDV